MSNLDIIQNHLNETYFLEKGKEYVAKGGKPVLNYEEFEKFDKQLKKESGKLSSGASKYTSLADKSQSLFSASTPIKNAWNYKMNMKPG